MKPWSRLVAFVLLALWLPVTHHCDLEAAGLGFLTHDDHASSTCRDTCADDACHNIEGISFTKVAGFLRVLPPPEPTLHDYLLKVLTPRLIEEAQPPAYGEHSSELLVLHRTWSFAHRAALPARAPDLVA